jgi:hypothetical protein
MQKVVEQINGYTYGTSEVATSPVTLQQLEALKVTVGFTEEDQRYLKQAGTVLADQTKQIVEHWRSGIIAGIPNLALQHRPHETSLEKAHPDQREGHFRSLSRQKVHTPRSGRPTRSGPVLQDKTPILTRI